MEVLTADYYNSGGNVYIYYGKLEDGKYYSLSGSTLYILNADYGENLTDEFYEKTDGDCYEWEQKHILEQFSFPTSDAEIKKTGKNIFKKLKELYPNSDRWEDRCCAELCLEGVTL